MTIPGYEDGAKAEKLISDAKGVVAQYEKDGTPIPVSPQMQAMVKMQGDAKSQADARLKQEIEKLHGTISSAAPAATKTETEPAKATEE